MITAIDEIELARKCLRVINGCTNEGQLTVALKFIARCAQYGLGEGSRKILCDKVVEAHLGILLLSRVGGES
jgi:hypothetical protein